MKMNGPTRHLATAAVRALAGLLAAHLLLTGSAARAATWSRTNCRGTSYAISTWKRSEAKTYAQAADKEGYEWGGGCYRLNDIDDTPNAPDSGGEGADCSGFVFKTWALVPIYGAPGFRYHEHEREIHGPYSTADFYRPCSTCPFKTLSSKSYFATNDMDAFVYRTNGGGHIGLIYSEGSGGLDLIVEAKSDALGTRIGWQDYRQQSAYKAIARTSWTPDCYPRCAI